MEKRATRQLVDRLRDEKEHRISGGIYQFLQVEAAYNSNHIEGSTLTHEQTRYIFETHSVSGENIRADDVVETVNHFRLFDRIIDTFDEPLTEDYVKELHRVLKTGTFSSLSREAVVGDYKKFANIVNDIETARPEKVHEDMKRLLSTENLKVPLILTDFWTSMHLLKKYIRFMTVMEGSGGFCSLKSASGATLSRSLLMITSSSIITGVCMSGRQEGRRAISVTHASPCRIR